MRENKTINKLFKIPPIIMILLCTMVSVKAQIIYDNGGLATGATTKSGVAAPAGTQWSEVQNNNFETTSSNTLAGVGCQLVGTTSNRCADDFMVPVGETWTITSVITFAYQTGFTGATSPFISANLRIWNGFPEAPGSTVVFGDTTTNRLGASTNSGLFRIFNTTTPAPGTAPGTTRIIWQNTINVSPGAVLGAGHYWIDWQTDAGTGGNFTPTVTTPGTRGAMIYNAVQKIGTAAFVTSVDAGNPAAAVDYNVDYPFKLTGSIAGTIGPRRSRTIDFNGDNKTDFAIARSASAGAQTTWSIFDSAGGTSGVAWGLGVGFAGGDIATPEDFDGDGKTDIAVWRPGAPNTAAFYILQSATNTVRIEVFGQTGDNPRVVDDYDGDGRSDVAVYRDGAAGQQSFFFYRGSMSNPGGNITFVPWGLGGDKPAPGDYDGDRKADFGVIRNEGGLARHFHSRTTQGFVTVQFGLFTDTFAPGDYDGDNKTDICMVRTSGASYDWNVLRSSNGVAFSTLILGGFGAAGDIIVQGDYDGDNRTDFAVWRTSATNNGVFYLAPTNSQVSGTKWGTSPADYPVANYNAF
jgi:hypothetical protein